MHPFSDDYSHTRDPGINFIFSTLNSFSYSMDVPRTQSGSPCKRCVKQGKVCSQHTSSMGTLSPFPIEDLNKNILFLMMLELPREQLNALCKTSKKYAIICRNDLFRQMYNEKHPEQMFVGELNWVRTKDSTENFVGTDQQGNSLHITYHYREGGNITINYYQGDKEKIRGSAKWDKFSWVVIYDENPNFFKTIGKSNWKTTAMYGKWTGLTKSSANKFYKVIIREIKIIGDEKIRERLETIFRFSKHGLK